MMKNNLLQIVIILILLTFTNCGSKEENVTKTTNDVKPLSELKQLSYLKKFTKFNEIFNSIDTINLETTSESLMDKPWSVRVNEKQIIVSDMFSTKHVLAFARNNGKFLGRIGSIGRGPEEYITPELIEVIGNELFLYDPGQMTVLVYNLDSKVFERSWKVKKYYVSITEINNKLIFLNKNLQGYENDFEIYDLNGNILTTGSFPKSMSEPKRSFLYGGAFKMTKCNRNIVYIGADEFKLILTDQFDRKQFWGNVKIPSLVKAPKIPTQGHNIKWLKENYSFLRGLFALNQGLIFIQVDDYFHVYDSGGNFICSTKNHAPKNIFCSDGEYVYEFTENFMSETKVILNPKVIVYKIKQNGD